MVNPSEKARQLFLDVFDEFSIIVDDRILQTPCSLLVFCVCFPYEVLGVVMECKKHKIDKPVVFFTEYKNVRYLKLLFPGFVFVSQYTGEKELFEVCNNLKKESVKLTVREREVLYGIMEGEKAHQICSELNISQNTFYTHKKNLLRKLKLNSTQQLIVYAVSELYLRTQHS